MRPHIGFIGQGWIGKTYSDDFERRGFEVVRFAKEPPYAQRAQDLARCDIVFIAVPTPTTPQGFDDSIVRDVLGLVGKGKTAVIKSTLLPGTTESLQNQYPELVVMHSPEFLSVATAQHDAEHPTRNIIGVAVDCPAYRARAKDVMAILPEAPYSLICTAREAELIKYGRNCLGFVRVVFINLMYDLARQLGVDWEPIRRAMAADPDCGPTYLDPVHKSGRGAGGACFIKDFEALSRLYRKVVDDQLGAAVFDSLTEKNIELLLGTEKDLDLLRGVHGDEVGAATRVSAVASAR
jgi:UDPglucose 6-dehydrogenase